MREYDEIAEWYASDRTQPTGVPEVTALAASVQREREFAVRGMIAGVEAMARCVEDPVAR